MTDLKRQAGSSDLSTRFAAGIVMAAVACTAIVLGGWVFRLLVLAAAAMMLIEWNDLHKVPRLWSYVGIVLLVALLGGYLEWLFPADEFEAAISPESFAPAWQGLAAAAGAAVVLGLLARRAAAFGGFVYVAVPSFALLVLDWIWYPIVFWVMLVTWGTDIFAYFAGRTIGGPKLAPRLSPNKTWSGLTGGVIGAAAAGWGVAYFFDLGMPFLVIGAPMAVLAQAGDLYESWLKRKAGVKDSGTILPGHGGVLDRLDGLLPVVVATLALMMTGMWSG